MKIEDNIIKEHLQNVLFLSGGAFGGKTTMAKLLEEKYGLLRYREGDYWSYHYSYANAKYQPELSLDRSGFTYDDWNNFYLRPVEEYYKWLTDGVREEAEMAIVDLIKLSQHQRVVADVMIPIDILREIADYQAASHRWWKLCEPLRAPELYFAVMRRSPAFVQRIRSYY